MERRRACSACQRGSGSVVSSGESEEEEEVGEKAKYDSESPKTSKDGDRSDEVSWSVHSSPREMTAWGE
jgi:hypothetical protein